MAQAKTDMTNTNYQPVIGLEVHVELATKSKMFCGCSAEHFGVKPNTHTCPVCLGLPGALPVPNKKAIEWTIMLGLALGCQINENSKFDRKNYFYPDLPKGYQISQYDEPLAIDGEIEIEKGDEIKKIIRIRRVHLEEDTGKLQHATINGEEVSLVDFNRSGVPLVEIVTEPDFRSIEEVDIYLKKLQKIIRYLGISGADMEKGSMRLEPSISISNEDWPKYRVELKNINSFRFARRAIEYEIERQTKLLEAGETPTQQTRGWNEAKSITYAQREKEEANDYRYFPEPDIPPIQFTKTAIRQLAEQIPELPDDKQTRFIRDYELNEYNAVILTETRELADYYEESIRVIRGMGDIREVGSTDIANWIINRKPDIEKILPAQLVEQIINSRNTPVVDDVKLDEVISVVLSENSKAAQDYKSGKIQVLGVLIGQLSKKLGGTPTAVQRELLERKLNG